MCNKPTILRELMSASVLLALASALLYMLGISYVNAYLTEWGVESSLIVLSTQDILVHGVSLLSIATIGVTAGALILGVTLYLYIHLASDISTSSCGRKLISKIKKRQYNKIKKPEPPVILQTAKRTTSQFLKLFIFVLFLIFTFLILLQFSSDTAVNVAKKEYSDFSSGKIIGENIFSRKKTLVINGVEREGYILANSDSLVVLYLPSPSNSSKEERVLVIPISSISEIKAVKVAT